MNMWMREMPAPPVTHVSRLLLLLSLALLLPSGAHGDILGVAETLGCKLRSHEAGVRDETPELLASLIDYGCYCNIGRLAGGPALSGVPVDAIDSCCSERVRCYTLVESSILSRKTGQSSYDFNDETEYDEEAANLDQSTAGMNGTLVKEAPLEEDGEGSGDASTYDEILSCEDLSYGVQCAHSLSEGVWGSANMCGKSEDGPVDMRPGSYGCCECDSVFAECIAEHKHNFNADFYDFSEQGDNECGVRLRTSSLHESGPESETTAADLYFGVHTPELNDPCPASCQADEECRSCVSMFSAEMCTALGTCADDCGSCDMYDMSLVGDSELLKTRPDEIVYEPEESSYLGKLRYYDAEAEYAVAPRGSGFGSIGEDEESSQAPADATLGATIAIASAEEANPGSESIGDARDTVEGETGGGAPIGDDSARHDTAPASEAHGVTGAGSVSPLPGSTVDEADGTSKDEDTEEYLPHPHHHPHLHRPATGADEITTSATADEETATIVSATVIDRDGNGPDAASVDGDDAEAAPLAAVVIVTDPKGADDSGSSSSNFASNLLVAVFIIAILLAALLVIVGIARSKRPMMTTMHM